MPHKTLKFLTWNVFSMGRRHSRLIHYIKNNDIDVACVQEPYTACTKIKTPPKIPDYHAYSSTGGTGLLTYVAHSVPHDVVKMSQSEDVQYHHLRLKTTQGFLSLYNVS